jgi:hypothetical protein
MKNIIQIPRVSQKRGTYFLYLPQKEKERNLSRPTCGKAFRSPNLKIFKGTMTF